jgi:hypothetical protein
MAGASAVADIKPWVSSLVVSTFGVNRPDVVESVLNCLSGELKRKQTLEKIKPLIGNASVATDFVDAVYKRFLEMKTSQLQKSIGTALKRPPEVVTADVAQSRVKRSRFETVDSSQDVLATTMKIVEEKQKAVKKMFAQHGIPVNVSSTTENLDKVRKAAELQAKIQAQLKANPALVSVSPLTVPTSLPSLSPCHHVTSLTLTVTTLPPSLLPCHLPHYDSCHLALWDHQTR